MKRWTIAVTDLQGKVYGRPQTYDRNFHFVLNAASTANFRVKLSDPWAGALRGDALVKAYYGADLLFHGLVTSYERVLDAQGNRSIAVTASDPSFRLAKRIVNRTTTIATTTADRGQIVKAAIDEANSAWGTGIRTGVQPYLSDSSVTYAMAPYKFVSEIVSELSSGAFDWRVMPIEFTGNTFADWYAEPVLGRHLEGDVIFEYGMGKKNVAEVRETGDLSGVANIVYHIVDAGPGAPGQPVLYGYDSTSESIRGRYEDIASASLTDASLRQALVDEHVIVRTGFRRSVSFTPSRGPMPRVPEFWTDYDVGDFVQARATDETGNWLDASMRIYQVDVAPDDHGIDTITLRLVDDTPNVAGGGD